MPEESVTIQGIQRILVSTKPVRVECLDLGGTHGHIALLQLMKDPAVMEKKSLERVLGVLLEKSQHGIGAVRQMAVRGLGNAVRGAPKEVRPTFALSDCSPSPARAW